MSYALLAELSRLTTQVLISLGVIVALGVLLAAVAMTLRKRLISDGDDDPAGPVGFSLADLRRLHAEGQLTDEELAQAEAKMLAKSRSHYLGTGDAAGPSGASPGAVNDSSTSDPPPGGRGAENPADDPDKNADGGPVA